MVDRYKVTVSNVTATAHAAAHPDGEFVRWGDYAALRAEVLSAVGQAQQHLEEVERLRAALRVIQSRANGSSHHMGAYIAEVTRDALGAVLPTREVQK